MSTESLDHAIILQQFQKEIFASIQHKYKQGHSYKRDPREAKFRISQLPYCSRKLVFSNLLGWDADSYMQEAAESGTMIHEIMQSALRENPNFKVLDPADLKIEDEVEFPFNSILIKGHIDILLTVFMGKLLIIDIKTINGIENYDRLKPKNHFEQRIENRNKKTFHKKQKNHLPSHLAKISKKTEKLSRKY